MTSPLPVRWLLFGLIGVAVPSAVQAQIGRVAGDPGVIAWREEAGPALGSLRWTEGSRGGIGSRTPWGIPDVRTTDTRLRSATYAVDAGSVRVVPSVVYVPDPAARMPGVVSVGLEREARGEPMTGKAALDWSGKPGGSFEANYRIAERDVAVSADSRPAGVLGLPGRRSPGSTVAGAWTERIGQGTTATLALSNDQLDLEGRDPQAGSGRMELRHRATGEWSLVGQVSGSNYTDGAAGQVRRSSVALGTIFEASGFGVRATVRDESSSVDARSGRGARVAVRGSLNGWFASVYADAQQQATTLELDVLGQPDLPGEVAEVGLVGASPEGAVQLLRDRGTLLAQHGVAFGSLRLDPLRVQGGVEVKWRQSGSRRTEVGMRLAMDELDGLAGPRRAMLGNLYASWRVFGETDLTASYANWSQRELSEDDSRSLFRLLVRAPL